MLQIGLICMDSVFFTNNNCFCDVGSGNNGQCYCSQLLPISSPTSRKIYDFHYFLMLCVLGFMIYSNITYNILHQLLCGWRYQPKLVANSQTSLILLADFAHVHMVIKKR